MPHLLDAGRSQFGFSRSGEAGRCLMLYSFTEVLQLPVVRGDPLDRGSLVHTGRAHFKKLVQWSQEGKEPEDIYAPVEAVHAHAELMRESGVPVKPEIERISADAVRQYVDHEALRPQRRVAAVEEPYRVLLNRGPEMPHGDCAVQRELTVLDQLERFGLQLVKDPRPGLGFLFWVRGPGGARVWTPELWHDHQIPPFYCLYTQRVDLVEWARLPGWGPEPFIIFDDLKTTNRRSPGRAERAYAHHGQFWGYKTLASCYFPELQAEQRITTQLTLILMPPKIGAAATFPEPQALPSKPWRERLHWWNIWQTYMRIVHLVNEKIDPWMWPAVGHEMGCDTKYGLCGAMDLCGQGPGYLDEWTMLQEIEPEAWDG